MSRRYLVVPAMLAFAALPALASEAGGDASAIRASIARMTPRVELIELFSRINGDGISIETEDGVSMVAQSAEVVIVRIGTDGKPVMACVDNPESAERFFTAPAGQLRSAKGYNQ